MIMQREVQIKRKRKRKVEKSKPDVIIRQKISVQKASKVHKVIDQIVHNLLWFLLCATPSAPCWKSRQIYIYTR